MALSLSIFLQANMEFRNGQQLTKTSVVIVGAGIGGMCIAIDLIKRNNCRDFIILEQCAGVGGTW